MAMQAAQLVAVIKVEGDVEAKQKISEVGKQADETGHSFSESLKHGLEIFGVFEAFRMAGEGVHFLGEQLLDVIKVAMAHQQIEAQTAQALISTHDASRMTALSIQDLAESLSKVTPYSQDAVQTVENLELTFTNIGKNVFPQATQAILDVSTAMHQDLKESAIEVGKALADPTTGLVALHRIGVVFTEQEKEQIKTLMAHHDLLGAQKIILHELAVEFGGSATAAGKTFSGQLQIMQNQFEDLKIKIGTALMPILTQMFTWISANAMPIVQDFSDWFLNTGVPALQEFSDFISNNLMPAMTPIEDWMTNTALPAMEDFSHWFIGTAVPALRDMARTILNNLLPPLKDLLKNVGGAIDNFRHWNDQTGFVTSALGFLKQVVSDASGVLGTLVGWVSQFVGWMNQGGPATDAVKVAIAGVLTVIAGFKLAEWLVDVNNKIGDVINTFGTWKDKAGEFLSWFKSSFIDPIISHFKSVKGGAEDVAASTKTIGDAAATSEGKVATAATSEEAQLASVTLSADEAATSTTGIGLAAEVSEGKVATESALMETQLGAEGVAGKAGLAATAVTGIGTAIVASLGPLSLAFAAIVLINDHIDDLINKIGQLLSIPGLDIIFRGVGTPGHFAHASGIMNNPVGHMALVGEQGPEMMYIPQGASIFPNSALSSMPGGSSGGPQIIVQPPEITLDGVRLSRQLMPYVASAIRYGTGVKI